MLSLLFLISILKLFSVENNLVIDCGWKSSDKNLNKCFLNKNINCGYHQRNNLCGLYHK